MLVVLLQLSLGSCDCFGQCGVWHSCLHISIVCDENGTRDGNLNNGGSLHRCGPPVYEWREWWRRERDIEKLPILYVYLNALSKKLEIVCDIQNIS